MKWPVSEYIRSARVLFLVHYVYNWSIRSIRLSTTWQVWYSHKKICEPTVHLGDWYRSHNTPLNPNPSDESHYNFHFLFETAVYLSHSISISTMTRYPNKRYLDSSLHWSLIVFYLSQPNHQSKKHKSGLNLQCPIPLSVLPALCLPFQGLNITETPLDLKTMM